MICRPSRRRGGFTLIELMVALVAGLIAVTATYYVGSAASRRWRSCSPLLRWPI